MRIQHQFGIFCLALLIGVVTANAAFKSSSTGRGTSKPAPPAVCVGDPGTNQPCVLTDDSVAFGKVADLKTKVAAGTATKADFEALGITISSDVDLDDADTIAYLNAKINAIVTSGNLTSSKKPSDLETTVNTATTANVALWTIYQTSISAVGYPTSGLTTSLLNNAGVSSTILSDTDTTLSNLQSNITSSGLSSSLSASDVENWIVDAAGFSGTTTYAQVQTATTNGWSIANFKTASSLGYSTSSADNTLFGEALGSSYTAHCRAEIDDDSASCSDLTKTQFNSAKSGSALLATKKTKVTAGTLVLSDLTELGLTTTALGSNPQQWQIDYLMTQLGTGNSVTKADWQTTITAFNSSTAALWKIAQIQSGASDHPTSDLSVSLLTGAGVSSSYTGISNIQTLLQGVITNATYTQSSDVTSASALDTWIAGLINPSWSTTPATSFSKAEDTVDSTGDQIVLTPASVDSTATITYTLSGDDASDFSVSGGTVTAAGTISPDTYSFTVTASTAYSTTSISRDFTLTVPDQVAQSSLSISTTYVNVSASKP